jgi:Tetraspanin family
LAYEGYTALLPQQSVLSADNLLIGIGVAMFVVAFFGCCGSWFQSRCMLVMVSLLKFTLKTIKSNPKIKYSTAN